MKNNMRAILFVAVLLSGLGMVSCRKYLDRSPQANILPTEPFINFRNFQGFTEELYCALPDMSHPNWTGDWNWGDDIVPSTTALQRLSHQFDVGNYWAWTTSGDSWLDERSGGVSVANTSNNDAKNKGLWPLSWYGIRKANMGLANLHNFVDGTQEEKDVIKGQLLFFRGFFHFQLMSYWGGLPYIDTLLILKGSEKLELPRQNYRATALKAAKDLEEAATLLPADWNKTNVGQATLNHNNGRVTRSAALAYLGKTLLYAASPLMNEESTGTPIYDAELCKKAAEAFTKVLKMSETGEAYYQLMPFATYGNIWYSTTNPVKHPGFPEVIFGPPTYDRGNTPFGLARQYVPSTIGGDLGVEAPTANYINNFGMANGLPIDDPASGYTTADPWTGRDPRFYKAIITDGTRMIQGSGGVDAYRFANLYTGGNYRSVSGASRTGYLTKKFTTAGNNDTDKDWDRMAITMPYLRLADVYLMYAEAVLHGYGTPQSNHPGNALTAVDAVNLIRARATVPPIDAKFLLSKESFMGELIRERAVELAYEGFRWMDLRRWKLAGNPKYLTKTSAEFDRGPNNKPLNYREQTLLVRIFQKKHEWLPLPVDQVSLYPGFGQNPGW